MNLSAVLAQPPVASGAGPSPFLSILTTLGGPRPSAEAAAPPATAAKVTDAAVTADSSQPSIGQKLLGGVADKQNRYLANQQMLAVISAGLGARFSAIAKGFWAQLRGAEPEPQPTTPPVESPPAG